VTRHQHQDQAPAVPAPVHQYQDQYQSSYFGVHF